MGRLTIIAGGSAVALALVSCGGSDPAPDPVPAPAVEAPVAESTAAAEPCTPDGCGPARCCLAPGTPGTVHFSAACTRRACPPGQCCNSCGAGVEFRPDGWPPRRAVALSNHGCVADGCGALTGCRVPEGAFTLPAGLKVMPDGSLRLPD